MTREECEERIGELGVQALTYYAEKHLPTGGCYEAILSNDLMGVFRCADDNTMANLRHIMFWLYNYAPGMCWGSPERVKDWLAARMG